MYKKLSIIALVALCAIAMSSCRSVLAPRAVNTIHPVGWEELNLVRNDYIILNTISAEASVSYIVTGKKMRIEDMGGDFAAIYKKQKVRGMFGKSYAWALDDVRGVARLGFLNNDYDDDQIMLRPEPSWFSRNIAIYKLINAAKMAGADGVIEPIISTNIEQVGKKIVFKTTVSGKMIKLKPDGK